MMGAQEKIARLRELVRKCYGVVTSKNGEVPEVGERTMENLPNAIASTHDTLEELTITQNGEYTPQEGVDGFSKVTAEFDTSSLPKVKLSSMRVSNACIDKNGYWAGELLDTSKLTSMSQLFGYCALLQHLDASGWDTSNIIIMEYAFAGCNALLKLDVSKWNTSKVTNMNSLFSDCRQLSQLDVSKWNTSKVIGMNNTFNGCVNLQQIDVSGWNCDSVTGISGIFKNCSKLQSIIGNRTINEVIANNIGALNGLKVALSLNGTILDRASLRALINGLADLTGETTQTLTLGTTLMAKLTEEDIAIAVNKNWTVV